MDRFIQVGQKCIFLTTKDNIWSLAEFTFTPVMNEEGQFLKFGSSYRFLKSHHEYIHFIWLLIMLCLFSYASLLFTIMPVFIFSQLGGKSIFLSFICPFVES